MPEVQMPKLSDTMTEGTLVSWKKKKGDKVSAGEVIAEIETDKATMEWESPEDGTLTEIYVEEGGKVNVGDKIAFIAGEGEEAAGILTMTLPREQKRHIVAVDSMGVVDPADDAPPHESLDRYILKRKLQGIIFDDQWFVTAIRGNGAPIVAPEIPDARLGRNAACWCGSGLKYKRCHGRLTS